MAWSPAESAAPGFVAIPANGSAENSTIAANSTPFLRISVLKLAITGRGAPLSPAFHLLLWCLPFEKNTAIASAVAVRRTRALIRASPGLKFNAPL